MQPTTASDDAWARARVIEMRAIGVRLYLIGGSVHGWHCEAIINGAVYCNEKGDSMRDAVEKTIARVIAARLDGLKFN